MKIDRSALKQFIGLFLTGLLSYLIMNSANAYLVNTLGQATYGDFSLTISLIFSLTPIFAIGITTLTTKYLPIFIDKKSTIDTNVFMKWNIQTLIRSLIAICIILITITVIRVTHLNESIPCIISNCHKYRHFIGDLQFLVPVALLLIWNSSLLNATKHSTLAQVLGASNITYVCAFVIFLSELFLSSFGNNTILISIFFGFMILCCLQYIAIYSLILKPKQLSLSDIKSPTIKGETRQFFFRKGVRLMTNSLSYIALGLISMLMIEWLATDEAVLGHYVVVVKISSMSMISIAAINFLIIPYLSDLKEEHRRKSLQSLLNFNHIISLVWLVICLGIFFAFRSMIFNAYYINFDYATLSICILLIFNYFFYGVLIKSQMICMYNEQNRKLYAVSAFQLIFLGILNYLLIPKFNFLGAIYATVISETICGIICWIIMRANHIKVKIFIVI